jgi:hypothetical protein
MKGKFPIITRRNFRDDFPEIYEDLAILPEMKIMIRM